MKKLFQMAGILGAFALMTGTASAQVVAVSTRTADFVFGVGACPGVGCPNIPLNDAGATSMAFVTTVANQRIVVNFMAECQVTAADLSTWVAAIIFVDGVQAYPSSTDRALCTSNNSSASWVSAIATGNLRVPAAGLHSITVRGQILAGAAGNTSRIDDISVVVFK